MKFILLFFVSIIACTPNTKLNKFKSDNKILIDSFAILNKDTYYFIRSRGLDLFKFQFYLSEDLNYKSINDSNCFFPKYNLCVLKSIKPSGLDVSLDNNISKLIISSFIQHLKNNNILCSSVNCNGYILSIKFLYEC